MIAFIPVRGPENDLLSSEYQRFLTDFASLAETTDILRLIDHDQGYNPISVISFSIINSSKNAGNEIEEIKSLSENYSFFRTDYIEEFMRIHFEIKNRENEDISFADTILNFAISKLSLLINLTYATKVDFLPGVILSNQAKFLGKTDILLNTLEYAYEQSMKVGWPNICALQLKDTLSWYNNNDLHTDKNSKNKLHRAINSFSYQFSKLLEKDTSTLFWTMLGIEALLAEGTNNIISQIKIKSSIILGEPLEYKKKLDKLYNYRSRFVHGDMDFPAKFSMDIANFEEEYWDYLHFATSILLALIRTLISSEKNHFKFEYRLIT